MSSLRPIFVFFFLLTACSTSILRLPASSSSYDPKKTKLLRNMAKQGVMFQFDDEFAKDLPFINIANTCQVVDEKKWAAPLFKLLEVFDDNPQLFKKIHVIYIRQGEKPGVEINEDKDEGHWAQGRYLTVTYKKTSHPEIVSEEEMEKCDPSRELKGASQATEVLWPEFEDIVKLLEKQSDKRKISRFDFDTGFLVYLANKMTVVRLTSAWAWEKSLKGIEVLPETMNRLSEQVKNGNIDHVSYWLDNIDQNSRLGHQLKFFSVVQDQKLARGIGVEGANGTRFLANIGPQLASTYLFVSYRSRGGEYQFSGLTELNECLKKFDPSDSVFYQKKSDRYLYPGYSCDQE